MSLGPMSLMSKRWTPETRMFEAALAVMGGVAMLLWLTVMIFGGEIRFVIQRPRRCVREGASAPAQGVRHDE